VSESDIYLRVRDLSKIAPIGGVHRSARSLLAEVMNDPYMVKCIVITMNEAGEIGWGHFETTRAEMTYAAAFINRMAFDERD
jgi:hypothetical protein